MELRDLAEHILFGTTLEEKLESPGVVTDTKPGAAISVPEAPGRPRELRFKTPGVSRGDFPGVHQLEQESERGRLLHFFANHELLATELMALALLRFPDAPAAFRRGVLRTLRDEQAHTRLYVERMRQCGIRFGELPVSGYFWRAVSTMANPLDYVAGLSLTFEQANLDFCRHFARSFEAVGDDRTARLLEQIYTDEIGHVAYGLKWFRRWKDQRLSDWDAFCQQLKFPLSPSRAKGIGLNIEGRRAAGFDSAFINALNVHAQSKGRTPNVFVFNPFVEARLACGPSFAPVKHQVALAADLANLPQFLCRQDDIVLVRRPPSVEFLSGLKLAGFALPEFVELKEGRIDPAGSLATRRLGRLRPWAWGPDSLELFEPLRGNATGEAPLEPQRFRTHIAPLYSKAWSAALLRKVLTRAADTPWLCSENEAGVVVNRIEEALEVIRDIRRRGHHRIVVKEVLGLAGQSMIRLWEPALLETQRRWMAGALDSGRQLIIEPWLERVIDFSVQLEMGPDGLQVCGYTGLVNDPQGQFQANWATPTCRRRLPAQLAALAPDPGRVLAAWQQLYTGICGLLEKELKDRAFRGPLGIDAFVYRPDARSVRLKPIVEINPRYTMGRVLVELMRQTCPGSHGSFQLFSRKQIRAAGHDDFVGYSRALTKRFPLQLEGEPIPRIHAGAICLNDPAQVRSCLAMFRVGPEASR